MNRSFVVAAVMFVAAAASLLPLGVRGQTDERARKLAETTIDRMGGLERWNDRQFLVWDIFGESHYWDKWSGDFRWEADSLTVLMNLNTKKGTAWIDGVEITAADQKKLILDRAYARWVNNSYWLIMPYKLLDPGVNLRYVGVDTSEAGQISDVIELTFQNVGLTPNNRYQVFIDRKSGMVCQWAYFENRENDMPNFVRPWGAWKDYNGMWMSTERGTDRHRVTKLSMPDELPRAVFTDPSPVSWRPQ